MFSFIISYGQLVKIFFHKFCYLFDTVIIAEKKSDATWLVLIYNVKWIRKLLKALAKIFDDQLRKHYERSNFFRSR